MPSWAFLDRVRLSSGGAAPLPRRRLVHPKKSTICATGISRNFFSVAACLIVISPPDSNLTSKLSYRAVDCAEPVKCSARSLAAMGSSIPYCASKGALNNLTVTLARVMAPKVRVNAIAPGFITGRWLRGGLGDVYDAAKKATEGRVLLEKVCDPEDVAEAVISVITGPDLMTGNVIPLEGGLLVSNFSPR